MSRLALAIFACFATLHATGALAQAGGATASVAQASPEPRLFDLVMRTREARIAGDNRAWLEHGQRVLALAPDHPDLLISVGRAFAANDRMAEGLALLQDAVERGAGFDLDTFPEFKAAAASPELAALRKQAAANAVPIAPPETFLVLRDTSLRPEGITYDSRSRHLYIGSLNGEIWQVDLKGALTRFASGSGLREVLGMKVDERRRLLWAVSGVFPDLFVTGEPKKDVGTTGVYAFNLDTRERVFACELDERPTLHGFNDLALAANGDVYVSDSTVGAIYRLSGGAGLPGGECRPERILQDDRMSFPNGIVLTRNDTRLYVAHVEGISAVELPSGRRTLLQVPANGAVNSIDGLALDGQELLGVQGSPYLARVARIRLNPDGLSVRDVRTMSSRPPLELNQTTGVVVGAHFYTVGGFPDALAAAAGQEERFSRILRARLR